MSSAVIFPAQPEQILKGLSKVWTSLGQEEKQQGKPTVLRACAMTLIVATDEEDRGFAASQTISELMRAHPSRGIVITIAPEAEHGLEARVLAQCWKPFGKAQQICCEQIEITARHDSWPNVGPTLIGLTVADLPVIFWCRHKAALQANASDQERAGLEAVLNLSTKTVVDTSEMDPTSAFDLLHRLRDAGPLIADLEWARLTPWRQTIAQTFDNVTRKVPFRAFHTVEITYGGERPCPGALYLAGWLLSHHLMRVEWKPGKSNDAPLQSIRLISDSETIVAERTGIDCARLWGSLGLERTFTVPERTSDMLLEEELALLGRDHSFEGAFKQAQELLIAV